MALWRRRAAGSSQSVALIDHLEEARREWQRARAYFDSVHDTDLVVEAVHRLEACQRKYMYLWKLARAQGARVDREQMARLLVGRESGISS